MGIHVATGQFGASYTNNIRAAHSDVLLNTALINVPLNFGPKLAWLTLRARSMGAKARMQYNRKSLTRLHIEAVFSSCTHGFAFLCDSKSVCCWLHSELPQQGFR